MCGQARRPKGNRGTKKQAYYRDMVCAFDIETSRIMHEGEMHSIMYVWQFAITDKAHKTIVIYMGRTWDTYRIITDAIDYACGEDFVVVYVHNLSYEMQFLSGIYNFENDGVFCMNPHKILKAVTGQIEYRCSMLHSNMSLSRWLSNLGTPHQKLSGEEYDYSKVRYAWTPLSQMELTYGIHDVLGLVEAIYTEMEKDGDTLYTIPLTSTGYVRRNVKRAMKPIAHQLIQTQLRLEADVFEMLQQAFRGGDTHANRYFTNRILKNVHSRDRSSSYPDVILNHQFPMTRFRRNCYVVTLDDIIEDISVRDRACLAEIQIWHYAQYDMYNGFPYLSYSKCRHVVNPVLDNGRILSADYLETTVTDIDLRIIIKETSDDSIIMAKRYYSAKYGNLPEPIKEEVRKYYRDKTELKGNPEMDYYYMKSKNLLNSIYGLMVQNPCKQSILYDDGEYNEDTIPIEELLEKYNRKSFTAYQHGVYVTAWARWELRKALWKVGRWAVYCDTDSVKYIGDADFSQMNKEYVEASKKSGAYATDAKGVTHYMGVYEDEGVYDRFATLGAKKYAFEKNGKLHITIAGVNKAKGAEELAENGGLERFLMKRKTPMYIGSNELDTDGFIFRKAGGHELIYNDEKSYGIHHTPDGDVEVTRNVVIKDSTYQLGLSGDYKRLLENVEYFYEEAL